jgi:molybdopterin/thiamine biosynthesis adenylyltransferase
MDILDITQDDLKQESSGSTAPLLDLSRMDDEKEDRYSRFRLIPWWDQEKLAAARVMVVGAGALGNEILKNLALLGIGHIYIVDFDNIENTNLSRSVLYRQRDEGSSKAETAARAVEEINPDCRVTWINGNVAWDVGLGCFRRMNVVIGGLDNREARLAINQACWRVGVPWIDGAIEVLFGVARVFVPPLSACYECTMTEQDYRLLNMRRSCALLSREEMLTGKIPTTPTISSIIGSSGFWGRRFYMHSLALFYSYIVTAQG